MKIADIQTRLAGAGIDGWLFYDFRRSNPIAYRTLELPDDLVVTRRWYYFVPATGEPRGLVSALEPTNLGTLPGKKRIYRTWEERRAALELMLPAGGRVAMEYSPFNAIPYVSTVDAGTVELIRSLGVEVVSSADLVQEAAARWSDEQRQGGEQDGEAGDDRRPGQVDPGRRPDGRRDQRVLAVEDRVREPAERPDHDLRVVERADVLAARLDHEPQPEVEERDGAVGGEGRRACPAAGRQLETRARRRHVGGSYSRLRPARAATPADSPLAPYVARWVPRKGACLSWESLLDSPRPKGEAFAARRRQNRSNRGDERDSPHERRTEDSSKSST